MAGHSGTTGVECPLFLQCRSDCRRATPGEGTCPQSGRSRPLDLAVGGSWRERFGHDSISHSSRRMRNGRGAVRVRARPGADLRASTGIVQHHGHEGRGVRPIRHGHASDGRLSTRWRRRRRAMCRCATSPGPFRSTLTSLPRDPTTRRARARTRAITPSRLRWRVDPPSRPRDLIRSNCARTRPNRARTRPNRA